MNYLKKDKSMYTNYKWEARRPVPKNEKGEWVVEITMIPAKPGAFVYVTVSKDGVVLNLERGE